MNKFRTHNCSELTENDKNKTITISGWVHRKRDHGNLLFIDLRDHFGITQCVIENKNKHFPILEKAKPEFVLKIIFFQFWKRQNLSPFLKLVGRWLKDLQEPKI